MWIRAPSIDDRMSWSRNTAAEWGRVASPGLRGNRRRGGLFWLQPLADKSGAKVSAAQCRGRDRPTSAGC